MKLNLGCGKDVRLCWVNADKYVKSDEIVYCDIDKKFPWKDNEFDEVFTRYVIEHAKDIENVFSEVHRVSKHGAIFEFEVPHCSNYEGLADFGHYSFFWREGVYKLCERNFYVPFKYEFVEAKFISTAPGFLKGLYNKFPYLAERYWARVFPILAMKCKIRVIKNV